MNESKVSKLNRDVLAMNGTNDIPRELMDSLVLSIVSFMYKAGMSKVEIRKSFGLAMRDMSSSVTEPKRNGSLKSSVIGCDTIAGAVLRSWHRDPEYLDELANPIPLSLSGRKNSLSSLVRAQDPRANVTELVSEMHRTGLIKRLASHKYLPKTNAATISQMHPYAVDHVVKTVLRLVETVTRNMRLIDSKHPLIERYAHVPDLDAKEAQAFAEFSRQQGVACLEAIEDWLEARRKGKSLTVGKRKKHSISAGMHVFAYLEDPAPARRAVREPKARAPTSPRAARV